MISAEFVPWLHRTMFATVTAPGGIGGECVDLTNDYLVKVWGQTPVRLNAAAWRHAVMPPEWDWENNLPTNFPPAGAIVVWRGGVTSEWISENGHVAVALFAAPMDLWTLDQNWVNTRYARPVWHSYDGVAGWWRRIRAGSAKVT